MPQLVILTRFALSLALGALIGLEREKAQQGHKGIDFAGIRTFILISFLGTFSAYIADLYENWLLAVFLICFVVIILAGYVVSSLINQNIGMTTELSAFIAFLIGIISYTSPKEIPILFAIVLTGLLSLKHSLHELVRKIKQQELFDTLKFIIISFVILPLVPKEDFFLPTIRGIGTVGINFYEIWLMIVFISSISFAGYFLMKIFGSDRGIGLTGFLGGVVSSTATMLHMAAQSKKSNKIQMLIFAALLASSTMFIRILIEVAILNKAILPFLLIPLLAMGVTGYASAFMFWRTKEKIRTTLDLGSPLRMGPAIKFGVFFAGILISWRRSPNYRLATEESILQALSQA